jgi:hypothetical protein
MASLPTDWEVLDTEYIKDDKLYKTRVMLPTQNKKDKTVVDVNIRVVYFPYKVRPGQYVKCPKLM